LRLTRAALVLACALIFGPPAAAQFRDDFDGPSLPKDPSGAAGWAFFAGEGKAELKPHPYGHALHTVTARILDEIQRIGEQLEAIIRHIRREAAIPDDIDILLDRYLNNLIHGAMESSIDHHTCICQSLSNYPCSYLMTV
jgi:hypothetical protein